MKDSNCCGSSSAEIPKNVKPGAIYTCPMHPEIEQDHPGFCPICGMSLEPKIVSVQADDSEYRTMLWRFWIGCLFTLPVLFFSMGNVKNGLSFQQAAWIQWICTTVVVFGCGWIFFERAWASVRNRSLNMFSLIALGVGAAYAYSLAAIFFPEWFPASFKSHGDLSLYFEVAAVLTLFVLLGQVLELKAKTQTSRAIMLLMNQAAKTARLVVGEAEKEVNIDDVKIGDVLKVLPGDKVPVDGKVIEGSSYVDEAMISGEALPVAKRVGDLVTGGTLNQAGSFLMEAKFVGENTLLSRIIQMVAEAQRSKAPIQRLTDLIANYFVPLVILVAGLTFILWFLFGPEPRFNYALLSAIAVLIIACPCALGLATPMSVMVGVGRGAEQGILIKNAAALERLGKVNTIVLDKTGTLTEGKPKLIKIFSLSKWTEEELLRLAAAVEKNSEHPLALAIVAAAEEKKLAIAPVSQFIYQAGQGVSGLVEQNHIAIGQLNFMKGFKMESIEKLENLIIPFQKQSQSTIFIGIEKEIAGFFVVADPIKPSTQKALDEMHQKGIRVVMLTGDNAVTAQAVAQTLKIDEVHAGMNPQDKIAFIQKLKSENQIVAMAGDGINDSPALAAADVGIAMGTGTDVAIESAEITLVKGNLSGINKAIALSKATMRNIKQNLFFAFIYNLAGIPIAAGVLYPFIGVLLNPMIAGAAMAFSSFSVILNALRLYRVKI